MYDTISLQFIHYKNTSIPTGPSPAIYGGIGEELKGLHQLRRPGQCNAALPLIPASRPPVAQAQASLDPLRLIH